MESSNPDVEAETMEGMVPYVIIFHAAREDSSAGVLFVELNNQIQTRRSYKMSAKLIAPKPPKHFIWLQFGSQSKWNSEIK